MAPTPPESTKSCLRRRLVTHARTRWPQLRDLQVRHRGQFAYISAQLPDEDEPVPLCRLRYTGSASTWGFAIYQASSDRYEDSHLPTGAPAGAPEQALDTACGLYLADPTAWLPINPRRTNAELPVASITTRDTPNARNRSARPNNDRVIVG